MKIGYVDRVMDTRTILVRDLFKKETTQEVFMSKPVVIDKTFKGVIIGTFGKSGKLKVRVESDLSGAEVEVTEELLGKEVELKMVVSAWKGS